MTPTTEELLQVIVDAFNNGRIFVEHIERDAQSSPIDRLTIVIRSVDPKITVKDPFNGIKYLRLMENELDLIQKAIIDHMDK